MVMTKSILLFFVQLNEMLKIHTETARQIFQKMIDFEMVILNNF